MYSGKSYSRKVVVGNQTVIVDSYLEEKVLRRLENSSFHNLWIKPTVGLNVGKNNYTPDIELSVQLDGMTHRALVEIKPAVRYFTTYIQKRMVGVAAHYHTQLLLLYAEEEDQWYRIDHKTGMLREFGMPIPGKIPIAKLYKPLALPASSVYNHSYKKAAMPAIAKGLANFMLEIIAAFFVTPKKRKYQGRSRRSAYRR